MQPCRKSEFRQNCVQIYKIGQHWTLRRKYVSIFYFLNENVQNDELLRYLNDDVVAKILLISFTRSKQHLIDFMDCGRQNRTLEIDMERFLWGGAYWIIGINMVT